MTTTLGAGTIPVAPQFPTDKDMTQYTPFFTKTTSTFTLLDRIDIYVVGEPYQTPQVGLYKLMNEWWALNTKKVQQAGILEQVQVSSWTCVVDLWWKGDFNPVRNNGVNPESAAPFTYQELGKTGDTIGFHILKDSGELDDLKQGAFLLRRTITTLGVNENAAALINAVAQVDSVVGTTNDLGITNQINYTDNSKNVVGAITWGQNQECDLNWEVPKITSTPVDGVTVTPNRSYGCYGMARPWGISTTRAYAAQTTVNGNIVPEVKGYVRVWKWLAEYYANTDSVFSMERGDTVNILVYEMIDKVDDPLNAGNWNTETYNWFTAQVVVAGACNLTVGIVATAWLFL